MERKIKIEKTIDLATAECQIFARYWEDSELNGVEDDASNPKMPCVESVEHFYYGKKKLAWCPIIDLDNGRILNWCRSEVAKIHYKSCDENVVIIKDRNGEEIKDYTGYVPRFLDPYRLHRRVKGNHKCLKTWQGCILYGMHNNYCPDYQPKEKKDK